MQIILRLLDKEKLSTKKVWIFLKTACTNYPRSYLNRGVIDSKENAFNEALTVTGTG
ncbi:hypothetical protein FOLKNPGA_03635 [Legionella sp. PC1000]|nr:hypothetical protein FOLKNPGA_03635 [Legionella sp. PC1000]